MKRLGMLLLGLAVCGAAMAQTASAVRKKAESSLLLNGHIVVAPDGSVQSFDLDPQPQAQDVVVDLVKRNSAKWRFEPVLDNGVPVTAKAPMHLRVVASPAGDGDSYQLRIASATFGERTYDQGVTYKEHGAVPRYPEEAIRARASGTVFLLLHIKRDGSVGDAAAEQVNLEQVGPEPAMRKMRQVLADSSIRVARQWTFNPPAAGPFKNADSWIIRVPVNYHLNDMNGKSLVPQDGWQTYIPGPKEPIPWMEEYRRTHKPEALGIDALPDGGIYLVGSGLQLLTTPDPS